MSLTPASRRHSDIQFIDPCIVKLSRSYIECLSIGFASPPSEPPSHMYPLAFPMLVSNNRSSHMQRQDFHLMSSKDQKKCISRKAYDVCNVKQDWNDEPSCKAARLLHKYQNQNQRRTRSDQRQEAGPAQRIQTPKHQNNQIKMQERTKENCSRRASIISGHSR